MFVGNATLWPEDQRGEALALEDLLKAHLAQGLLKDGIQCAKDDGGRKSPWHLHGIFICSGF